jgi:hypothetical protein
VSNGELVDGLENLGWISFDVRDFWVREDELKEGLFAAVVGLGFLSAVEIEVGKDGKAYFNSCLNGFS